MSDRPANRPRALRLGITGAGALQAKEIAELLPASPLAIGVPPVIRHFDHADDERTGRHLATIAGEPVVLEPLNAEALQGLDAVFFSGNPAETRIWAPRAAAAGAIALDLTSVLDHAAGPREIRVPHPAAEILAAVLPALAALGVQQTAATIFEPASERGMAGIEELRDQTLRLLSVQSLPTAVFGGQIAFNLCTDLGEEAQPALAEVAAAIAADVRALAASTGFALPALHVMQAPIFHAHVISLLAEWDDPPAGDPLVAALRAIPAVFCPAGEPQPDAVNAAGESGIQLGAPMRDPLRPGAFWIAISADNLRLRAASAVHLAGRALGCV